MVPTISGLRLVTLSMKNADQMDASRRLLSAYMPIKVTIAVYRHMESAHWKDGPQCHRRLRKNSASHF